MSVTKSIITSLLLHERQKGLNQRIFFFNFLLIQQETLGNSNARFETVWNKNIRQKYKKQANLTGIYQVVQENISAVKSR